MTKRFTEKQLEELKSVSSHLDVQEASKMHFTAEASDERKLMAHKTTRREQGGPTIYTVEYHSKEMEIKLKTFDEFDKFKDFIGTF